MTLGAGNLVASSVIITLMLVFGIWVRYVVTQQLKLKDAP